MTTLSLEHSRAIHALIGEYETEKTHRIEDSQILKIHPKHPLAHQVNKWKTIPAPTFAELIRVLPRIWEVIKRPLAPIIVDLADKYMHAPSEPEGMKAVEDYLMKLLK